MSSLKQQHPQQRASWGRFSEFEFNSSLAVRSNSSKSSGLKSRPGSCPYAPVAGEAASWQHGVVSFQTAREQAVTQVNSGVPAYSGSDLATAAHERKAASASCALRGRLCCDVPQRCRGTAKSGASCAGTTGPQPQRDQDPYRGRHPSELQLPGFHDSDESRGEHWKAVPECPAGGQIAEEDQGETDGTDGKEIDRHPLGRHSGKREPQPERLGELLSLSELKSGDEQGQKPCGRPTANPLDEAP